MRQRSGHARPHPRPSSAGGGFSRAELRVLILAAAVQFINMTDGIMINPLGPKLAEGLGISTAHIGYIGGSYVLAACITGLINSLFLDRFDRRGALGIAAAGLAIGTALGAAAIDLPTMLLSRVVAGIFGGTCSALSLAIIADAIPPERRGRAMGAATVAFAAANVLGVPIGFQLAFWGGWRMPFLAIGGTGLIVAIGVYRLLPPQRAHMRAVPPPASAAMAELGAMLRRPIVLFALATALTNVIAGGLIVPNLAAYFIHNLAYPEPSLGFLWAVGGVAGLIAGQIAGNLADRLDPMRTLWLLSILMAAHWTLMFVFFQPGWPLTAAFAAFVALNIARMTTTSTLMTRVTPSHERGRFLSLASVAQSGGSGMASFMAAALLVERADGGLANMATIGLVAVCFTLSTPFLMLYVWRRLRTEGEDRDGPAEELLPPLGLD